MDDLPVELKLEILERLDYVTLSKLPLPLPFPISVDLRKKYHYILDYTEFFDALESALLSHEWQIVDWLTCGKFNVKEYRYIKKISGTWNKKLVR